MAHSHWFELLHHRDGFVHLIGKPKAVEPQAKALKISTREWQVHQKQERD
jgi:hypothetical protein